MRHIFLVFFLLTRLPSRSTRFPYTILFPSRVAVERIMTLREDVAVGWETLHQWGDDVARVERCEDRKSTRLNSSHMSISYAVLCLGKKKYNIILFQTDVCYLLIVITIFVSL